MAIFDYMGVGGQQPASPEEVNLLTNIQNSVQPAQPMTTQAPQQVPVQQEQGILDRFAGAMSNPDFLMQLQRMGAAFGNDGQGYNQATNAYINRLSQRQDQQRQERLAKEQQRLQLELEERKNKQYVQNQEVQALYNNYTPESVREFLATGDYSVLVPNKQLQLREQALQQAEERLNIQGSAEGRKQEGQQFALAENGILLGDGRTTVREPGVFTGTDNVRYRVERGPSGLSAKPVAQAEQEAYDAKSSGPSQRSMQTLNDIEAVRKGIENDKVGSFTGQIQGRSDLLADISSSTYASQEERDLYQAAKRIQGQLQNLSIDVARQMGASGINSLPEFEMFARSMPQLDMTSSEALKSSLDAVQAVIDASAYGKTPSTSTGGQVSPMYEGISAPQANMQSPQQTQPQMTSQASESVPVGNVVNIGGRPYRKISQGPDSDRSTWEPI